MMVTIDRQDCTSCAVCWDSCPQVFEENPDDGFSQIVAKFRSAGDPGTGKLPDDLKGCAQEAADGCPVEIIHVEA
jgi:ferredoxin